MPACCWSKPQFCIEPRNAPFDKGELAETDGARRPAGDRRRKPAVSSTTRSRNIHRSIGARLSGEIARRYGDLGMENAPITLQLTGSAGQSFGVWNAGGLHLYLEGDANDYVGKGMAGGKLVIYPPRQSQFASQQTPIIGNTCLYGATGGMLFAAGTAGERFAVRNSGAHGGGGRRRRSRLRIHDRRRRGRAGRNRGELRRRHDRRFCLCAR